MKDVKEIHDIPQIENHMDKEFKLVLYERGDNIQIYKHKLNSGFYFYLEVVSEEKLIEGKDKLINIITQDDIGFLEFSLIEDATGMSVCDSSWCYRPLVDEKDKNY